MSMKSQEGSANQVDFVSKLLFLLDLTESCILGEPNGTARSKAEGKGGATDSSKEPDTALVGSPKWRRRQGLAVFSSTAWVRAG